MTDKKTKTTAKAPEERQPEELQDRELDGAQGGAQGLVAHELTHGTKAQFNPKEISVDRSVPWKKS